MRKLYIPSTLRTFAGVAALALVATACEEDPVGPDDEPDTTQIVLTIGTGATAQVVTWTTASGSVVPTNVNIPAGPPRVFTATFLRADGSVDPVINELEFRLDFTATGGAGVTVGKTNNLAGTITASGTAGQSVTFTLGLVHILEGHYDYLTIAGALRITVQ